jgi:predicted thioesterase
MKSRPRIGTVGELSFTVAQEHAIDFAAGGMPTVLSTPKLIGLIERTARESLYPFLDENERTVGVEIEVRHLAPTPLGQRVIITTRVIHVEAKLVDFQFEVRDEQEMIARGLHKRAVITVESFARRVARKTGRA